MKCMARGQALGLVLLLLSFATGSHLKALAENTPEARGVAAPKAQALCMPTAQILAGLQVCYENNAFVEKSKKCLADFQHTVEVHSRALPGSFARGPSEGQNLKFSDTLTDYKAAIQDFQGLIATNRLADKELNSYLNNLVKPFNLRDQLDVPCLGNTVSAIRSDLKKLREERTQLEQALNSAEANHRHASSSHSGLDADSSSTPAAKLVKGRAPASAVPKLVRKPKQGPSDISGTTAAIEQAARARAILSR